MKETQALAGMILKCFLIIILVMPMIKLIFMFVKLIGAYNIEAAIKMLEGNIGAGRHDSINLLTNDRDDIIDFCYIDYVGYHQITIGVKQLYILRVLPLKRMMKRKSLRYNQISIAMFKEIIELQSN